MQLRIMDALQEHVAMGQGELLPTEKWVDLDIDKKFFTVRLVRPWQRLPRAAVAAPSVGVFQTRFDTDRVWWKVPLPVAGG